MGVRTPRQAVPTSASRSAPGARTPAPSAGRPTADATATPSSHPPSAWVTELHAFRLAGVVGTAPRDAEDLVPDSHRLPGTSNVPSLRRIHHPCTTKPPLSAAISSTLTQPPLPRPPESVLRDPVLNATISANPHLFLISTPIDVQRYASFTACHPNRPLVNSILVGLTEGFWPAHNGVFDESRSWIPIHDTEENLDLLATHFADDFEKSYLSEPFSERLPGTHRSNSFVANTETERPRQVCDQSASGLNDGMDAEFAKTPYDFISSLAELDKHLVDTGQFGDSALRSSDGRELVVPQLFKSDVQGRFRNLPVSLHWQTKQIHTVRTRDSSGRDVWSHHVDHP